MFLSLVFIVKVAEFHALCIAENSYRMLRPHQTLRLRDTVS